MVGRIGSMKEGGLAWVPTSQQWLGGLMKLLHLACKPYGRFAFETAVMMTNLGWNQMC